MAPAYASVVALPPSRAYGGGIDGSSSGSARLLTAPPLHLGARHDIERYLDELNRASPVAERLIRAWSRGGDDWLGISAVLHSDVAGGTQGSPTTEVFIGEGHFSFDVEMTTRNPGAAPDSYVIGLPVTGQLSVTMNGRDTHALAGEGVVVDPSRVERTRLTGESHFVEFYLPRRELQRLAAEWAPGAVPAAPLFEPHLQPALAQRLLFMATQAATVLQSDGPIAGKRMLFRRWIEMIGLSLLQEQPFAEVAARRSPVGSPAPASLRRALEYIHAHADADIGLADIAEAACTSVSSLLRHFNSHLGQSPFSFLRGVRLDRARNELRGDGALSIREIALRWGFQNASKFTSAYQQRFGERPSETRAGSHR